MDSNHRSIPYEGTALTTKLYTHMKWSGWLDLNQRHLGSKPRTLPTELHPVTSKTLGEEVGFEPTIPLASITVFKTAALNLSATLPSGAG